MDERQKAYVCLHVFDNVAPVLLVSRADGDWQFLCGASHPDEAAQLRVVGAGHLLERDPSLQEVVDLPVDWEAERTEVGGPWSRIPIT